MTGFGTVRVETERYAIEVLLKTLNSKYLDFNMKPNPVLLTHEPEIRSMISQELVRGKILLDLNFKTLKAVSSAQINHEIVQHYYQELQKVAQKLDAPTHDLFRMAMQLPNTYTSDTNVCGDDEWQVLKDAILRAIAKCKEFRADEGKNLQVMLDASITRIEDVLGEVERRDPERIVRIRQKLNKHIQEFVSHDAFDENRFAQEMVYYVEKLDIAEEKTRLRSHLPYFRQIMQSSSNSHGKKLNFIAQEIGREINTIGSKANDVQIQHLVVEMKEELDKIKEQISNVV